MTVSLFMDKAASVIADKPWKLRVSYTLVMALSAFAGVAHTAIPWTHAINWATFGYMLKVAVDFERIERHLQRERMMPWYELALRLRWTLAVTRDLPPYLRIRCLDQEMRRPPALPAGLQQAIFTAVEQIFELE